MADLLHQLLKVVWHEETVYKQWREGLIVRREIRNILVITGVLSVVRKVVCKVITG